MKKIFYILFLLFISISTSFASNDIKIISREEWGANENYRYLDSIEWQNIIKNREEQALKDKDIVYTQAQINAAKARQDKNNEINKILIEDFGSDIEIDSKNYTENGRELVWAIEKTKKINGIVIHHTDSSSSSANSVDQVKSIYKYHALSLERGDIGYNYLIGKNGEIYEGRAGGNYVVAAHDKWNNRTNIGIAIIGDYSEEAINTNQYNALKNLTEYLVVKYNIDLTKKIYFHSECIGINCKTPLISELKDPLIGHRDAGHTDCPGDALYAQINDIKSDLLKTPILISDSYKIRIFKSLEKFSDEKLINILANVENDLEKEKILSKVKLKSLLIEYFEYKKNKAILNPPLVEVGNSSNDIKIKLSYPNNDNIKIKSGTLNFEITREGNFINIKGHKFESLTIPKKDKNSILEITSWDRVPTWDKTGKYNDNKFRGDLTISVKDDKLLVVNTLKIEDYLKGLGEVSDSETPEKIKTLIIAARSYATWYTSKDRKFPGESYDGSDDPDVFQKYLGYGLEQRSPNINKIVNETKGQLITYKGELIKPWYFSNSDGKTMSFYDYCKSRNPDQICLTESKKYPYLQSVADKGSQGKTKAGHGVGISGAGVSYFAEKGWTYDMIIKYFLKGVDVL